MILSPAFPVSSVSFSRVISKRWGAIDFGTGASGYGIAPKISLDNSNNQKPRIEVFNPVDDNDDQKTSTTILFDNNHKFLAFGAKALQIYAEIIDDGETALLFQTVILNYN